MSVESLEPFQLENLFLAHVPFLLLDVSADPAAAPVGFEMHWHHRTPIDPQQALSFVEARSVSKETPIVILCEFGETSLRTAEAITEAGYTNVYVVAGGVRALCR